MAGANILIVEDNPLNLELIWDILEAKGFVITAAITGVEALKKVDDEVPDLIPMGLDGLTI